MSADEVWSLWSLIPLAGLVSFLALELPAVKAHQWARTLSDTLRRWFGIMPKAARRWVIVPVFVLVSFGFPAWLVPHIVLGI